MVRPLLDSGMWKTIFANMLQVQLDNFRYHRRSVVRRAIRVPARPIYAQVHHLAVSVIQIISLLLRDVLLALHQVSPKLDSQSSDHPESVRVLQLGWRANEETYRSRNA